uniref:Pentatricopeptide repeat-containing protein n=1 Tax=Populus alba TaxID=43335 RepID=A0A4U5PYG5_POPAL|nr:hypothetical protein D5086_0000174370 [Populus alba]
MACELYDTTARPTVDGIGGYIELEHDICHSMQELHSKLLPLFSTDSFTSYVMCSRLPINVVCASAALWPVVIISYLGTSKLYDRESSNCAVGQILRNIKLCFAIPAICMREILLHGLTMSEQRQGIGILKLFDEMESVNGVPREPKHYGCMADLPGRAGLIKEVTEMIKDIPKGGDMSVWSGLLGGRRIHGDVEIAEKAAKHKDPLLSKIVSNGAWGNSPLDKDPSVILLHKAVAGHQVPLPEPSTGCCLANTSTFVTSGSTLCYVAL